MENVHSVHRPFAWRGLALAAGLVLVIVLAALGGMALLHRLSGTRPVSDSGHLRKSQGSTVALRPRSRLSVLVLNGNGVNGAAGALATKLLGDGYRHAIPTDAPNHGYATSFVFYRPGFAAEAKRLARDSRIAAVAPLDGRLPAAYAGVPLTVVVGR